MNYHNELFHALLNDFLQGESALLTIEGDILAVRGEKPVSYGTLATAGLTANKYLKLQEGDIAILNDPYSGGSILSEMTFVMAVSEDLIWVSRRSLGSTINLGQSVEEEGLRIPPTPIKQKNQINEMILGAMASHPLCPPDLSNWVKEQCADMTHHGLRLVEAIELSGFTITSDIIERYLDLSKNSAFQRVGERSSGETRVDVVLDSGELLRLGMEIHDGKISIDFGGTSGSKTISLTESATLGVCFHTIAKFYGFDHIANSGSSSLLQITKPSGSWLNAKYPAATYKGMTCGVAALKTALEMALSQLHKKGEHALTSHCSMQLNLQHGRNSFFFNLPGGQGASPQRSGSAARLQAFSIEKLEELLPLKILTIDRRPSLNSASQQEGGLGLLLKVEVREAVDICWLTDLTLHKPRISKNCSHGGPGEVLLECAGESKYLPVLGQQKLSAGAIITLCSGSGGSYNKA